MGWVEQGGGGLRFSLTLPGPTITGLGSWQSGSQANTQANIIRFRPSPILAHIRLLKKV